MCICSSVRDEDIRDSGEGGVRALSEVRQTAKEIKEIGGGSGLGLGIEAGCVGGMGMTMDNRF